MSATEAALPTRSSAPHRTHVVQNQVPALEGFDAFGEHRPLVEGLHREGGGFAEDRAQELGRLAGDPELLAHGVRANENPPVLRTHDRFGHRIDEVDYHPSYHELMRTSLAHGLHALPWRERRPGAHVARAAMFLTFTRVEAGHMCPISMTYAVVPALAATRPLAEEWAPRLNSSAYDPVLRRAADKPGALAGMAMTEKQGGSDVRANTTVAEPVGAGGPGAEYELVGHKWFCSAPMCDVFLVLAQAPGGLSCFVVPRVLDDGTRNAFELQRLKDKLGNRSNASSEVQFHGALGRLLGEEGRGVRTIIEMVNLTRLDCVLGSAGGMRLGVEQATHHAAHRSAFGRRLIDQPLMQNVLADLCLESEAATAVGLRLARAFDVADQREVAFRRLATAVSKFWVCKRGPAHAAEALECLGGNGYVEESGMPRLYREMPLASVWEGSGNVNALDVLRALAKSPQALEAFHAEVELARGADRRLDAALDGLDALFAEPETLEQRARSVVSRLAVVLQASLLVRHAPAAVADAFCAGRLGAEPGLTFGTLPPGLELEAIVDRHRPRL
ncbi:MAG: Acyl-CoA dehydrogenase [uncultured Solirubrobacterales bacterium]|uniref:Acyl-CoA dehydrogenase n=1 Tax=uncultured Solirubrobacterales bacterium TaxID=768556 RepID=A0A6J4S9Z9_9ACTN|nr:MAG: Acyl-CoA dehydrogenase [uncultured Solirubrobacterales bacterium]